MSKIDALRGDALPQAAGTPGILRFLAFEGEGHVVIRSKADPGTVSAWHHHGDYEVYGYIVSGSERLEFGPEGADAVVAGEGDFFHIPPHTVHRDVNPSPDAPQRAVLFLVGTGPMVINVDGPETP